MIREKTDLPHAHSWRVLFPDENNSGFPQIDSLAKMANRTASFGIWIYPKFFRSWNESSGQLLWNILHQ